MRRPDPTAAQAAADQADAALTRASSENDQLTDETVLLPGVAASAQLAASVAVAEQLRALRLTVVETGDTVARAVGRSGR